MSVEVKLEKQKVIDEIKAKFDGAKAVVVVDYMGITVLEADDMRRKLREEDIDYTVYKNTLVKRAVAGTEFEGLADVLDGPSAFAISKSEATAPARVLNNAMKEYKKMEFKAGVVEGKFMDKEAIIELADIPSREVLIAKFMGSVQSPMSKLVRTIQAVADAGEVVENVEA